MRTTRTVFSMTLALLLASAAIAQQAPRTVVQVNRQKIAPGKGAAYEAARKKHMAWHRQAGDPWTWTIWAVTTGPDTGTYLITTGDHQWADFDTWGAKHGAGDTADAALSTGPHVASNETSYWTTRPDLSRMPPTNDPPPMGTLTTYYLKPGAGNDFTGALTKINGALAKANWNQSAVWYQLSNGGEPAFAVFTPRKGMADLQPPEPSMAAVVEKQLGAAEANAAWKVFFDSIRYSRSEMLEQRADLSYRPAK